MDTSASGPLIALLLGTALGVREESITLVEEHGTESLC